jgi:diguanylate cyclase (GGDEF)-like protein
VQALVSDIKRRARVEREHVRKLTDSHQALQAVAELAREITSAANPRRLICETAVSGAGASLATLVEPDGRGGFDVTGSAGIPIDFDRLRASVRPNASLRAYYSRTAVFVPDVAGEEGVSPLIVQATGLSSIVYEPIIRQERPVGILCVGWAEPRSLLDERTAMLIAFLAAEAGAALERADLVAQLDDLAHTDTLTGLPNRRQWDRLAAAAVRDSRSALCAAIIDLDHFKEFNDRHGHQAGDELLRTTAQIWRSQLRDDDLLARYGGEEFALLLRGPLAEAERVVERLRASTPTVTCSAGIAERLRGESLERLVERADKALYDAKRSGRDRLVAA